MPNYFTGHVDKWLLLSESETDFAVLFVRSWIPFNAWYCNNYSEHTDRICIDKIKTDGNIFRARMIALLNGSDSQSQVFKGHVGMLHDLLEQHPIPDASLANKISFGNIYFRENPITSIPPKKKRNLEFKTERQQNGSVRAVVVTNATPPVTKYNYVYNKYDFNHFEMDLNQTSLKQDYKSFLTDCFKQINPRRKESVLSATKKNSILIGGTYFINDCHLLSQALLEVLYAIRCKLFHGELQPSKDNLKVYEPGYHILRILLHSLR